MSSRDQARLLLAIVREDWALADRLTARTPVAASFAELCVACDVHAQVHGVLERAGRLAWAGPAGERLTQLRARVRADNLLLIAAAERAADALLARGVPVLALKGLDLIHRVYERFDERTLDDIDVLVPRERLADALAALEEAGWHAPEEPQRTHYIRSSHHLPLDAPGPLPVGYELHWNLAQEGRFRVDPAGLLRRARPLDVGGRALLRCDDHDLVAHLLLHHLAHYFDTRLKWLVDLRRLAARPGFDWSLVVERVREWDARVACAASVRHLKKLDPELIPADVLAALPLPLSRRACLAPLRSSHPLELYRGTRRRRTQLLLAAVLLERWSRLPAWLAHRRRRGREKSDHPLDRS